MIAKLTKLKSWYAGKDNQLMICWGRWGCWGCWGRWGCWGCWGWGGRQAEETKANDADEADETNIWQGQPFDEADDANVATKADEIIGAGATSKAIVIDETNVFNKAIVTNDWQGP